MAKRKHTHERHPGGRGRHNPQTPPGERPLHYGVTDRAQRADRAELRSVGGAVGVGVGFSVLSGGQFGDITGTGNDMDADDMSAAPAAAPAPSAPAVGGAM